MTRQAWGEMRVLDITSFPLSNSHWEGAVGTATLLPPSNHSFHSANARRHLLALCSARCRGCRVSLTCDLLAELVDSGRLPWYLQVAVFASGPGLGTLGPRSSHRLYPADVCIQLSNVTGQGERTRLRWPRAFYLPGPLLLRL